MKSETTATTLLIENKRQRMAEALLAARVQKGISQKKLAEMINISENTVIRIEKCVFSPNLDILYKLAAALEINLKVNNIEI